MTFADRLVFYVLVGVALVLLLSGDGREPGAAARVTGEDGFERVTPLAESARVEVPGPLGVTVVEISDGAARVLESPCPHELCVRMGAAREPGQSAVCIPNRVVVMVVGDAPARVDAISR